MLAPAQRDWLIARLDAEKARREAVRSYSLRQALLDRRVLLLSLVYFGGTFSGYSIAARRGIHTGPRGGCCRRTAPRNGSVGRLSYAACISSSASS